MGENVHNPGESVSTALIDRVASVDGVHAEELAPLAHSINPDALDAIFAPRLNGELRDTTGHVAFEYEGYEIEVSSEGTITVDPAASHHHEE